MRLMTIACCAFLLAACGREAAPTAQESETLLARAGASLLAVDTVSGKVREAPAGAHDQLWTTVYSADAGPERTTVKATDPATGRTLRSTELDGSWTIPIAAGTTPEGAVSGDDAWLILAGPSNAEESEFALLDTQFKAPPRRFSLPGRFDFDALAPDGSAVYLSQIESDGRYAVRAFDVDTGRLRPNVIVEKTAIGTIMEGVPVARAVDPTGAPVHTLYRGGPVGAFVHSLDTSQGTAICILLPRSRQAGPQWRLRLDPDVNELHAVNRELGTHYLIDPATGDVADAPAGTPLPGTRLGGYALDGDMVTTGAKQLAELGDDAELLAVR